MFVDPITEEITKLLKEILELLIPISQTDFMELVKPLCPICQKPFTGVLTTHVQNHYTSGLFNIETEEENKQRFAARVVKPLKKYKLEAPLDTLRHPAVIQYFKLINAMQVDLIRCIQRHTPTFDFLKTAKSLLVAGINEDTDTDTD